MQDWFYHHPTDGLCLTFTAMIDCGVPENTLHVASTRGSRAWAMIDHPEDKRRRLIVWCNLSKTHQERVHHTLRKLTGCKHGDAEHCVCGDPATYIAKAPIRKLVQLDYKAEEYYRTRLLEMKVSNVSEYVNKYTTAASWLNMLLKMNEDKKFIKKQLHLSIDQFFGHVCEIIKSDNIDLPASYSRLKIRMIEYRTEGYACLVSSKFGNKNTAKLGSLLRRDDNAEKRVFDADLYEKQLAIIRNIASRHNNFDAAQVTSFVNNVFRAEGWNTVSDSTVYNIMKAQEHLTTPGRRGKRVWESDISMQVKRSRPVYPLQMLTMDGWDVELAYMDKDGKPNRLVLVVVLDVMNNYPVGYAIGPRENTDLIKQANRNALLHINDLFGGYYQPRQMQSDNFGIKTLMPFFQAMTHMHIPAAVGNAKSKVIEPYFKYLNKTYCQLQYNFTGFGLTSRKENQVNREFHDKIKKQFPNMAGVISQIEAMMHQERELKQEVYLQQWEAKPIEDKRLLCKQDLLWLFGKPTGFTNSLTGQGLAPTINGQTLIYDSFDPEFRNNRHRKWQVIYDEYDLSSILVVSDDEKQLRFVLDQKRIIPMDRASMNDDDHKYLTEIQAYNKTRREEIVQHYIEDAAVVAEIADNKQLDSQTELLLKGHYTFNGQQKEGLQDAKGLKRPLLRRGDKVDDRQEQDNFDAMRNQYLTDKIDFKKYED